MKWQEIWGALIQLLPVRMSKCFLTSIKIDIFGVVKGGALYQLIKIVSNAITGDRIQHIQEGCVWVGNHGFRIYREKKTTGRGGKSPTMTSAVTLKPRNPAGYLSGLSCHY